MVMVTYVAELVASFFGDGRTGSLLDELGEKVDARGLALDSAVRGVLVGSAGLVVVLADGLGGWVEGSGRAGHG